jgi:cytochrome c-type biogenesis protein CcmH/NrfG
MYYRSLAQIEISKLSVVAAEDPSKFSKDQIQSDYMATLSAAITAGLAARDADPTDYLNWISLGNVYDAAVAGGVSGAFERAQLAYSEALSRNPKNPMIYLYFAKLSADNSDLVQARIYADDAISMKKDYLDAYYLLAQIEVADKNLKGAIDSVAAASVLSPNDPSVFFQLGLLQYDNQDYADAITSLEKSLALSPSYANAQYFLGLSYEITGQHAAAITQFENLAKTNPDNAEVATILTALEAGKPIFKTQSNPTTLPVQQSQ